MGVKGSLEQGGGSSHNKEGEQGTKIFYILNEDKKIFLFQNLGSEQFFFQNVKL